MKNKKSLLEIIKELRKKPYGKAVFFFGFYIIFFIIIFILINTSSKSDINTSTSSVVNLNSILNKNYSFTYKVVLDDTTYLYEGDKLNDEILYKYNDNEYYVNKDNVDVENPIKFKSFLDEDIIKKIVDEGYLESKTTYESGKIIYNFLISSNNINKIIENKDTDYEEIPNKISIIKENNIEEITFSLNSYCLNNKLCDKSLKIIVNYDNHNNIKDIEKPIE